MNFIPDKDLVEEGVVMRLSEFERIVETNVPWSVVYHSAGGFAWGYNGSGPADLALNTMEALLTRMGWNGPSMKFTDDIIIFSLTAKYYQDFKEMFLANLPEEGGVLPWSVVSLWLSKRIVKSYETAQKEGGQFLGTSSGTIHE